MATNLLHPRLPRPSTTRDPSTTLDLVAHVRADGPAFMDRVIRKVSASFKGLDVLDLGCSPGT